MPPKNKPMKPTPKTRMGYAKATWDESMKRADRPGGSGTMSPVTWAVGASLAMNAAMTKTDPFAKTPKKPAAKPAKKPMKKK